jgi:hypothetical protein
MVAPLRRQASSAEFMADNAERIQRPGDFLEEV